MPSLRRSVADLAERLLGVKILHPNALHPGALVERLEAEHLRKFLQRFKIDCVFDVGANEGQYIGRIRAQGYRGPIVSFEPIPALAARLAEQALRDGNLFVEACALDRSPGSRMFNIMTQSSFSSLHTPTSTETGGIFEAVNSVRQTLTVEARTLDELFPKWQAKLGFARPFLKLDTQGHDLAVIQGGLLALPHFVGVQTELSVRRLYTETPGYREVLDFYEAHGFCLSTLIVNPHHFPHLVEMDAIFMRDERPGSEAVED
jgi:FkbM family methyltransferase